MSRQVRPPQTRIVFRGLSMARQFVSCRLIAEFLGISVTQYCGESLRETCWHWLSSSNTRERGWEVLGVFEKTPQGAERGQKSPAVAARRRRLVVLTAAASAGASLSPTATVSTGSSLSVIAALPKASVYDGIRTGDVACHRLLAGGLFVGTSYRGDK